MTVATDTAGQFTDIGDGIAYAQSNQIPTVTVLAGTYPAVTVSATPTVTVIGETGNSDGYSDNEVEVSEAGTALTIAANVDGITVKNINFVNKAADHDAVILRGTKLGFYGCQFISVAAGGVAISTDLGLGVIANSLIKARETLIEGTATLYLFNNVVVPVGNSAVIVYNKGTNYDKKLYNSTIVFDKSSVTDDQGVSSTDVYLAAAKGAGSVAFYRGSALGKLIAATGVRVDAKTQNDKNFYAEYDNTGPGAYPSNKDARAPYVTLLGSSDLSSFSLIAVLSGAHPKFATPDTSWIDAQVLAAIKAADGDDSGGSGSDTGDGTGDGPGDGSGSSRPNPGDLVVSKKPSKDQYETVTAAIATIPDDGEPYTVFIYAGTYEEQITISRKGKVTLRGATTFKNDFSKNTVKIEYSAAVDSSPSDNSKTAVISVEDNGGETVVALYNIDFQNTSPQKSGTEALVARFEGLVAAYGCSFIGYHHTFFADKGTQVLSNTYVEGSIDFIWGYSTLFAHQSYIAVNTPGNSIAEQGRSSKSAKGGFVFDASLVTQTSSYGDSNGKTYLGRPYNKYSRVVYMNSFLGDLINAAGWSVFSSSSPQTDDVLFGEYNNSGPGSDLTDRASFAKALSKEEAEAYSLTNWVGDTSWIDMTAYNYQPSYDLSGGDATGSVPGTSSGTSPDGSSGDGSPITSQGTHPDSGTTPPTGAILVSNSKSVDGAFGTLTDALNALPSDGTPQVIFIYAGTYQEQVPTIDRDGLITIIGYTNGDPGQTYTDNKVTITFSAGKSISIGSSSQGKSISKQATTSTSSNEISWYNINIVNSDNLDGSKSSYISPAAVIYGSKIAFYGCSFVGWEETLFTGDASSYQYYESSYIEGANDFIMGYSKAYFKGCTIAAKLKNGAISAQGRPSSKSIGGFIFDQCLFAAASSASDDLTESVYLGRPYSQYALVVVKFSKLTHIISPSGWTNWSSKDPRTDHVTFAEYKNTGPGSWENNQKAREDFGHAELLDKDSYTLSSVMDSTDWIDLTYFDSITTPTDSDGSAPDSTSPDTSSSTSPDTSTSTSPSGSGSGSNDGSSPPDGALIVSKTSIKDTKTYKTIKDALDTIPKSSKDTTTIFIYPGVYKEKLEVTSSGLIILMGYTKSKDKYADNEVTIENDSTTSSDTDEAFADTATINIKGGSLRVFNINLSNTKSGSDGSSSAALVISTSTNTSIYDCQILGGQITIIVNGNIFISNSYIEETNVVISGSGAGYILRSKIAPTDEDSPGKPKLIFTLSDLVFDQIAIHPLGSQSDSGTGEGSDMDPTSGSGSDNDNGGSSGNNTRLGGYSRFKSSSKLLLDGPQPLSQNARVAVIFCNLGSSIESAEWHKPTSSGSRTGNPLIGEYRNTGPGSNAAKHSPFSIALDDASVARFQLQNFFRNISWIDLGAVRGTPFVVGKAPEGPSIASRGALFNNAYATTRSAVTLSPISTTISFNGNLSTTLATRVTTDGAIISTQTYT